MTESKVTSQSALARCPSCGEDVEMDASRCPACAAALNTGLPAFSEVPGPVEMPSEQRALEGVPVLAHQPVPPAGSEGNSDAGAPSVPSANGIGQADPLPWSEKDPGGLDPPVRPSLDPLMTTVSPPGKVRSAAERSQMVAAVAAAVLAVAVFTGILVWLHHSSQPVLAEAASGAQNSAANSPGVIGTGSSQVPGAVSPGSIQTNGSAGVDPGSSVDSPLQIYWRPATAEYFAEHPSIPTSSIRIPDGYSASLVRVDVENTGPSPIILQPGAFLLTAPGAYASLSRQKLPGSLVPSTVAAHGSVQGWLLFIKPWWDVTSDGQTVMVRLVYGAPPGAHVNLSNHAPARPIPVPSAAPGRWVPRPNETTYSV